MRAAAGLDGEGAYVVNNEANWEGAGFAHQHWRSAAGCDAGGRQGRPQGGMLVLGGAERDRTADLVNDIHAVPTIAQVKYGASLGFLDGIFIMYTSILVYTITALSQVILMPREPCQARLSWRQFGDSLELETGLV
jgi:hypothetical protein